MKALPQPAGSPRPPEPGGARDRGGEQGAGGALPALPAAPTSPRQSPRPPRGCGSGRGGPGSGRGAGARLRRRGRGAERAITFVSINTHGDRSGLPPEPLGDNCLRRGASLKTKKGWGYWPPPPAGARRFKVRKHSRTHLRAGTVTQRVVPKTFPGGAEERGGSLWRSPHRKEIKKGEKKTRLSAVPPASSPPGPAETCGQHRARPRDLRLCLPRAPRARRGNSPPPEKKNKKSTTWRPLLIPT